MKEGKIQQILQSKKDYRGIYEQLYAKLTNLLSNDMDK